MVTEAPRRSTALRALRALALAGAAAWAPLAPGAGQQAAALARAQATFEARDYRAAVALLEPLVGGQDPPAAAWLLLGKSYGRLAESEPWFRAAPLAVRTRKALERAVELAPADADALSALAQFYERAPAAVGGGADRAAAIRARLAQVQGQDPRHTPVPR